MGKKVDRIIREIEKNIDEPKGDKTKREAAIATAKNKGLIRQAKRGNSLALTEKGRKAG